MIGGISTRSTGTVSDLGGNLFLPVDQRSPREITARTNTGSHCFTCDFINTNTWAVAGDTTLETSSCSF